MLDWNAIFKKEWYIEHFDGYPQNTEMTTSGFTRRLYNADVPKYGLCFCFYKRGQADWISTVQDQKKIGTDLINDFILNKNKLLNLYDKWILEYKLMKKRYYRLFDEDLSVLTNRGLLIWVKDLYEFFRERVSMPGFIDGFMFYADKRLNDLLMNFFKNKNIKDLNEIFSLLSSAIEPSFINEEENNLWKISKIYDKDINKFNELLAKHIKKYSWIKSSYIGYKKYSFDDAKLEVLEILKNGKVHGTDFYNDIKRKKQKLLKKYKFNKEVLAIVKLTELLVKWQDQRKEYTLVFNSLMEKIRIEISKRTGIDPELIKFSHSQELGAILNRSFPVAELKARQNGCLFSYQDGKIKGLFCGAKAVEIFKKLSHIDVSDANEIKGLSASLGNVVGVVKIVMSVKDLGKINKGDILVAGMTRPEHLPGMRRAAAIVTDDGGITCHASIISRELGIPCVIGTKIATRVLKDGDIVEVNANHGVVTVIKKV